MSLPVQIPRLTIVSRLTLMSVATTSAAVTLSRLSAHAARSGLLTGAAVVIVAGLLTYLYARHVFAPISALKDELVAMAAATSQLELDARTLAVLDFQLGDLRKTLYGRGEPRRKGDTLYFGDLPINNDVALVDRIGARDGMLVTVFMGDRRVTTNVRKADGSRSIGTTLDPGPVYDRVLKHGQTYRGEANIFGMPHFAIYEPIVANGETIGILFVGTPRLAAQKAAGLSDNGSLNDIDAMRAAVHGLGKAGKAKELAEKEMANLRQQAEEQRHRRAAEEAQAAQERARAVQERARAMEEISNIVKQNAANAAGADRVATDTCAVAERGGEVASQAAEAMSRIEDASRKIADIISVIDEIARQTNLLALNAAVEAARAGDAGRGFAVVAVEVRELAQRSSHAAKDIKALIENSSERVQEGVALVNSAGKSLAEIGGSIKQVADIVSGIAVANDAQAKSLAQINKALAQLDEIANPHVATVDDGEASQAA